MSNFGFLERERVDYIDRIAQRKQHIAEVRRECFKQKLKMIGADTDQMVDYCRDLIRSSEDVSEELKELETIANGLLLVALILKREQGKV